MQTKPPAWLDALVKRFLPSELYEELLGDLHEQFAFQSEKVSPQKARWIYFFEVLRFCRPYFLKRRFNSPSDTHYTTSYTYSPAMIRNYFKIAFRNLLKHKGYSFINIFGLATGMAVAMLIGLWVWDELSYDKYHKNYDRIAKVMQRGVFNGDFGAGAHMPLPLGNELRTLYGTDFTHVVMSSWTNEHILAYGEKKFTKKGNYLSPEAPDMFSLKMLKGERTGLKDPSSILLSESVALALFDDTDPIGKIVKIDNKLNVKVTGVYEDLPYNTDFRDMTFIAPWDLYVSTESWVKRAQDNVEWNNNSWQMLAQIAPNTDFKTITEKIKNVKIKHVPEMATFKNEVFLHPMSQWHLYTGWDKTAQPDGRIQ